MRFRVEHAQFADRYAKLFDSEDRFGGSQLAHALEHAAARLGAIELERAAARLAIKRRENDDPDAELAQVRALLNGLLLEIEQILANADSAAPVQREPCDAAPAVDHIIASSLQQLSKLLADFDASAINRFEALRPLLRGLAKQEQIEELQRAIDGFDFALAQDRLQQLAIDLRVQVGSTS